MTEPIPDWPAADQDAAISEGWDVFECRDTEHEPFELERIDFPEDGSEAPFAGDPEAWEHVVTRAVAGSDLHNRALLFLAYASPGEIVHIAFWRAGIGDQCPCVGCTSYRGRTGTISDGTPNTEGG